MPTRRWNLIVAVGAVLLFAAMHIRTGRIPTDRGQGYDGVDYGRMMTASLNSGTPITELRPMIILLNRPLYQWIHSRAQTPAERVARRPDDIVRTFAIMNHLYAFALALGLLALLGRYSVPVPIRAYVICNVFLTICVARMLAYYPVVVDLGAYAIITIAVWLVLAERRLAAAVATVAAALSREFGVTVALFGLHRDYRKGVPILRSAATYLPGVIAWIGIRLVVQYVWNTPNRLQQFEFLMNNGRFWRDPLFAAFFFYFLFTVFGGLTLILTANLRRVGQFLRLEPEWCTFALPIAIAAALGGPETWRYLGCLVPAVIVLFAAVERQWGRAERLTMLAAGLAATLLTQQPFHPMTLDRYFIEWFPYYVALGDTPLRQHAAELQPWWGWRLFGVAAAMWLLALSTRQARTGSVASTEFSRLSEGK